VLDMNRVRPVPPSLVDPPGWLRSLEGFDSFAVVADDRTLSAYPDGATDSTEFPGGTWRVAVTMPADLTITKGQVDPLLLLVALANSAVNIETKIDELVGVSRAAGKTWTQVGQALGMSKQAAWERFSGED